MDRTNYSRIVRVEEIMRNTIIFLLSILLLGANLGCAHFQKDYQDKDFVDNLEENVGETVIDKLGDEDNLPPEHLTEDKP